MMPSNKGIKILKSSNSLKKTIQSKNISGSRPNPPFVNKNPNLVISTNSSPRKQNFQTIKD